MVCAAHVLYVCVCVIFYFILTKIELNLPSACAAGDDALLKSVKIIKIINQYKKQQNKELD